MRAAPGFLRQFSAGQAELLQHREDRMLSVVRGRIRLRRLGPEAEPEQALRASDGCCLARECLYRIDAVENSLIFVSSEPQLDPWAV